MSRKSEKRDRVNKRQIELYDMQMARQRRELTSRYASRTKSNETLEDVLAIAAHIFFVSIPVGVLAFLVYNSIT